MLIGTPESQNKNNAPTETPLKHILTSYPIFSKNTMHVVQLHLHFYMVENIQYPHTKIRLPSRQLKP